MQKPDLIIPIQACGLAALCRDLLDRNFKQTHLALDDVKALASCIALIHHQTLFFTTAMRICLEYV